MSNYFKCKYSIEDLEQFRDENGFIDLTKAGVGITQETREMMGNPDRVKNWVDFNGTKALIKGENSDTGKNNGIYAELIVEEIFSQLGIETAHYDLIKCKDENGGMVCGVLSQSIVDTDKGEDLLTLHDIIGDEENPKSRNITDYEFVISRLNSQLRMKGYDEEQISKVVSDFKKRLLATIVTIDEDKHTENFSFIVTNKPNEKSTIRIAPNYDSEGSFLMPMNQDTLDMIINDEGVDVGLIESAVQSVVPKIGVLDDEEEEYVLDDTLDNLFEDDELFSFYSDNLAFNIDMDSVIDRVEKRIKADIPQNVKILAKYSFQCRDEYLRDISGLSYNDVDSSKLLKSLINLGISKGITTSEQVATGKRLEDNSDKLNHNKEQNSDDRNL